MLPLAIFGLGAPEIIAVFIIILVVFGAGKLPQIGTSLGKALQNFRKSVKSEEQPSKGNQLPSKTDKENS